MRLQSKVMSVFLVLSCMVQIPSVGLLSSTLVFAHQRAFTETFSHEDIGSVPGGWFGTKSTPLSNSPVNVKIIENPLFPTGVSTQSTLAKDGEYYRNFAMYQYIYPDKSALTLRPEQSRDYYISWNMLLNEGDTGSAVGTVILDIGNTKQAGGLVRVYRGGVELRNGVYRPAADGAYAQTNNFLMNRVYTFVIKVSVSPNSTLCYLKGFPYGGHGNGNAGWDIETNITTLTNTTREIDYLGFSTYNFKAVQIGNISVDIYDSGDYAKLGSLEGIVEKINARTAAQEDVEYLTNPENRVGGWLGDSFEIKNKDIFEKIEASNQVVSRIEEVSGMDKTLGNYPLIDGKLREIDEMIKSFKDLFPEKALEAESLVAALWKSLEDLIIEAAASSDGFHYAAGARLNETTAADGLGWLTGWVAGYEKAGEAYTATPLDDHVTMGSADTFETTEDVEMYRVLAFPMDLGDNWKHYVKWNFTAAENPAAGSNASFGISLATSFIGVKEHSGSFIPVITCGADTVRGTQGIAPGKAYTAVLKIAGSADEADMFYLKIHPSDETEPVAWQLTTRFSSDEIIDGLGLCAQNLVSKRVGFSGIRKETYPADYGDQAEQAVEALLAQKTVTKELQARTAVERLKSSILKDFLLKHVDIALTELQSTFPRITIVSIDGKSAVGEVLTGAYDLMDESGTRNREILKWRVGGSEVSGANGKTFVVPSNAQGKAVTFEVIPVNVYGENGGGAVSAPLRIPSQGAGGGGGGGGILPSVSTPAPEINVGGIVTSREKTTFLDIQNHWARADIEDVATLSIVNGTTETAFEPDAYVTRSEFTAMLVRALGISPVPYQSQFNDIDMQDNAWYADIVQAAAMAGIVKGSGGLFRPGDAILREEITKMVIVSYQLRTQTDFSEGAALSFKDAGQISDWAKPYVAEAAKLRIVNGVSENEFAPKDYATRAQAAVFIKRFLEAKNAYLKN